MGIVALERQLIPRASSLQVQTATALCRRKVLEACLYNELESSRITTLLRCWAVHC